MASAISKQQQYRRLMKEKKSSLQQAKIDHPLAKYNSLGQLLCVVCSVPVKSEVLWATHLQSRKHKDGVAALKAKKTTAATTPTATPTATPVQPSEPPRMKGGGRVDKGKGKMKEDGDVAPLKRGLPNDSYASEDPPVKKKPRRQPEPVPSSLPAGFFDAGVSKKFRPQGEEVMYESSDSEGDGPEEEAPAPASKATLPSGLPADFFDRKTETTPSSATAEAQSSAKSASGQKVTPSTSGNLPEGFFDDPKLDAKVRKVEYKNPLDEEWEKFQKSIQKENDVSEVIVFEEDEEAMEEREVEEVNQQVNCFTKAEQLRQSYEQLVAHRTEHAQSASEHVEVHSSTEEEDEEDFDEFLNWRAKIS